MSLYHKIITIYPHLKDQHHIFMNGHITLQDDSDGRGPYIHSWNLDTHPEPHPDDLSTIDPENSEASK